MLKNIALSTYLVLSLTGCSTTRPSQQLSIMPSVNCHKSSTANNNGFPIDNFALNAKYKF
jgi:uncharacterized lipoprotein YmbA